MKASLIASAFLAALLVAGCNTTPPPARQAVSSQDRDRDRDRERREHDEQIRKDQERQDQIREDQARRDQPPPCPVGQHYENVNGRPVCVRDR